MEEKKKDFWPTACKHKFNSTRVIAGFEVAFFDFLSKSFEDLVSSVF